MKRSALTLLELVVVLAILATLTLVAVVSTEGVVEQGRFDVTQRTLQNIDDAVLGPEGRPDAPSFVSDIGRQPIAVGTDPSMQLSELWMNPEEAGGPGGFHLRPFGLATASDGDVKLMSGWRGPYLRLPVGTANLLDGWGNPFSLLVRTGTPTPVTAGHGDSITYVRSAGGPVPYNVILERPKPYLEPHPRGYTGTLIVSIRLPTADGSPTPSPALIRVFGADGTTAPGVKQYKAKKDEAHLYELDEENATPNGGPTVFEGVGIGTVAIRAYKKPAMAWEPNSSVVYLRVPSGGVSTVTLNALTP